RARSAYKLLEIMERTRLFKRGSRVLDLGACPGSWLQVAAQIVGPEGLVVGIDLKPIDPRGLPRNVLLMEGDLRDLTVQDLPPEAKGRFFDAVISDMGPDTSGVPSADSARSVHLCMALLEKLPDLLKPGGHCTMKVYEGGEYPGLLKYAQKLFDEARGYKPKASRDESVEMFIVCRGYRGLPQGHATPHDPRIAKGRPSTGWGTPKE
ncbi:MAG: RlmE family RNA methyltransferase, partial [Phycisphaerae bacterium]|nr:RlmE family RNA methyltransferase [Phycisphaerae bacterium]